MGFLISNDRKTFIVQPREKKDFRSFRVRINPIGKTQVFSYKLCESLAKINGWCSGCSYRVYGKVFPGQSIAVFDFSSSEMIGDSECND